MDRNIAVISARRTPCGKIPGVLSGVSDVEMLAQVFRKVADSTKGVPIDVALAGSAFPVEHDNLCRKAVLSAALSPSIPAATVSKTCASSDEALFQGIQAIQCGRADTVLIGGVEKNSNSPHILGVMKQKIKNAIQGNLPFYDSVAEQIQENDMAYLAEMLSRKYGFCREKLDHYAYQSLEKARRAQNSGCLQEEILPVPYDGGDKPAYLCADETVQNDASFHDFQHAEPLFLKDGLHTRYTAAPISDCAAAILLMEERTALKNGIRPKAIIKDYLSIGVPLHNVGEAMGLCVQQLLSRASLSVAEVDLYEINEAFAAQGLAVIEALGIPPERVNVNGGNIALGYPVGATGLRMDVTLLWEMSRRKARFGVSVISAGGHMSQATLFETWR